MPSVVTSLATIIGLDVQHGLTRMRWQNATATLPTASEVDTSLAALITFWAGVAGSIPIGIAIDPEDAAIVVDEATGLTTAAVSASTVPAGTTGTDSGTIHVSGTGARVTWRTGVRRGSREVRGATMVIPLGSGAFDGSGNVNSGTITTIAAAANSYLAAMTTGGLVPVVYGRPLPASIHHGPLAGLAAPITIADVSAVPAFLRRRRS